MLCLTALYEYIYVYNILILVYIQHKGDVSLKKKDSLNIHSVPRSKHVVSVLKASELIPYAQNNRCLF